jgi:hypothetical protein
METQKIETQKMETQNMETQKIFVRRATLADLELIVPLFDAYRQFYELAQDLPLAREFLRESSNPIFRRPARSEFSS